MAYVIGEPCIGVKDASCVPVSTFARLIASIRRRTPHIMMAAPDSMESRNSISIQWDALTAALASRFARCRPFFH